MKGAMRQCSRWTRGRFLGMMGVLFVLQAGLIFLFGDRARPRLTVSAPWVRFRALGALASEDQLLDRFFVGDPAVFALPNLHGFSGRGWLEQRPLEYQPDKQLEPPIWLNVDTAQLGINMTGFPANSEPIASGLAGPAARYAEAWPGFLAPEAIPTQSVFRLEGGLGDRMLGAGPVLRAWTNPQPLTKSVVEIAVNPLGEVIAARLEARCGSAEADADALAKASALRFCASSPAGTQWGEAVFQWQTSEPAGGGAQK